MSAPYNPDTHFDPSISILKDSAADAFGGQEAQSDGWETKRYAQIGRVDDTGARSYSRVKEYGLRPRVGPMYHEQLTFRIFKDPDEGGGGGASGNQHGGTTYTPGEGGANGSLGFGIGVNAEGGGSQKYAYHEIGFETGLVVDFQASVRDTPEWNPWNVHGFNRSTLIHSRELLRDPDKGGDLPRRYFGRTVDIMSVHATQRVSLKRNVFRGGGASEGEAGLNADLQGIGAAGLGDTAGGGKEEEDFFSKDSEEEEVDEGVHKTMWNITPTDHPIFEFERKNEHEGDMERYGYEAHPDIPGQPRDLAAEGYLALIPPVWHQGGWMVDHRQLGMAQITDLIGIDCKEAESEPIRLPRWKTVQEGWHVGIPYIRHDAHFQKKGDDECPPPLANGTRMSGRIYFTKVVKCPPVPAPTSAGGGDVASGPNFPAPLNGDTGAGQGGAPGETFAEPPTEEAPGTPVCGEMIFDVDLYNKDTDVEHECGEWRPMIMSGPAGGSTKDKSWHNPPPKYSGSGSTTTNGTPTPTTTAPT